MERDFLVKYLAERNYWWKIGKIYEEDSGFPRREYAEMLLKALQFNRIIAVTGIRRAGKTTILFQLIRRLLNEGIEPKRIAYIKIDEILGKFGDMRELVSLYEEITGIDAQKEKVHFIFDEIQYHDGWQFQLKHLIDARYASKFIVTGSSTSLLLSQAKESLAGRLTFIDVAPLLFREFAEFSSAEINLKKNTDLSIDGIRGARAKYESLLPNKEKLIHLFNEYINIGSFPEWFKVKIQDTENPLMSWRNLLTEYFELIIHKDVIESFREKIRDPVLIEKIAREAAQFSSNRFSYSSMANRLGASKDTVREYLFYLEASSIISISEVYFKTKKAREKVEKKVYFCDEGLRRALTLDYDDGKGAETAVNMHLSHLCKCVQPFKKLAYWKNSKEVDFIWEGREIIPIEVKYQENPWADGLLECMERFGLKAGILVTRDRFEVRNMEGKTILLIPAWAFLSIF